MLVHEYNSRLGDSNLGIDFLEEAKSCDDDNVTRSYEMRGSSIDTHIARTCLAKNGVGFESRPASHIPDMHRFERRDSRRDQEIGRKCERAFIMKVRLGNRCAVNFRSQEFSEHSQIVPKP